MLTPQQKNAIENLLILVDYVKESSIYSEEDGKIIDKSIKVAEDLIGIRMNSSEEESETTKLLAEEIKKRFNA